MSEPTLSACAALVRRHDPVLFRSALFASEPARERLMVLYAFDIELSRATARASEPLIAAMRLRWWREVLEAASAGPMLRAHEVAGPLHDLMAAGHLQPDELVSLIAAREMELEAPFDRPAFERWCAARFGVLTRIAVAVLAPDAAARDAAEHAGRALARAFVLRSAGPMAARGGPVLIPDLDSQGLVALTNGQGSPELSECLVTMAEEGLAAVRAARAQRGKVPRAAVPAFLPLADAARVLRRVIRARGSLAALAGAAHLAAPPTLWRALTGRW